MDTIIKLSNMLPFPRRIFWAHKKICEQEFKKDGIEIYYYCGYRSPDKQNELYEIGRTKQVNLPTITDAKAWESYHQFGCAVDCVPVIGDKIVWTANDVYDRIGILGEGLGLTWGGRFRGIDKPHFELTGGLSTGEMRKLRGDDINAHIESRYKMQGMMKTLELAEADYV